MAIRDTDNPWVAGEKLLAADLNDTVGALMGVDEYFTAGETISERQQVYLKSSDGKVWLADGDTFDESNINWIGVAMEAGTANNPIRIRRFGFSTGHSGLTTGNPYYLAAVGSTQSDIDNSAQAGSGSVNIGNAAGTPSRVAIPFTLTLPAKLVDITIRIRTSGSPAGNLVAKLYHGTPNGTAADGGGQAHGKQVTLAAASVTSSMANYTLDFDDVILPAGAYYIVLYHDTESSGNLFLNDAGAGGGSTAYTWASGSWGSNTQTYFQVNFLAETFAAGSISDYFYTTKKQVGVAVSSTVLMMTQKTGISSMITKTAGTNYIAETDGFIVVMSTGGAWTLKINNTQVFTGADDAPGTFPVRKGDSCLASLGTVYFIPLF